LRDGFDSCEEAGAHAQIIWNESQSKYSAVYCERYEGEGWIPRGGRCHLQALRALTEHYEELFASGDYGDSPVLVHGYCKCFKKVDGKPVPSVHAWIEGEGHVLDCGSYILKPTPHEKNRYYDEKEVVKVYRYTREEAEQHMQVDEIPYPWDPPPKEFVRERATWDQLQRRQT